jgi:hypothetical protein
MGSRFLVLRIFQNRQSITALCSVVVNRHIAKPLRLVGAYRRLLISVPGFSSSRLEIFSTAPRYRSQMKKSRPPKLCPLCGGAQKPPAKKFRSITGARARAEKALAKVVENFVVESGDDKTADNFAELRNRPGKPL